MSDYAAQLELHRLWVESLGEAGRRLELIGQDVRHVPFAGLNLAQVDIVESDASGTSFEGADLYCSFVVSSTVTGANFANVCLAKACFERNEASDCDFRGANALRCTFDESCLTGANFDEADLRRASFHGADLRGATMNGAVLDETCFDRARCPSELFDGLKGSIFVELMWWDDDVDPTPAEETARRLAGRSEVEVRYTGHHGSA